MDTPQKLEYLALSAFGDEQTGVVAKLTAFVAKYDCNVDTINMSNLGTKIGINLLIAGSWSNIAKLEVALPKIEQEAHGHLQLVHQRSQHREHPKASIAYVAHVVAIDHPGIIAEISHFFVSAKVPILSLRADTYLSGHPDTKILILNVSISIPEAVNISTLRDNFLTLCDEFNLDGILEPERR